MLGTSTTSPPLPPAPPPSSCFSCGRHPLHHHLRFLHRHRRRRCLGSPRCCCLYCFFPSRAETPLRFGCRRLASCPVPQAERRWGLIAITRSPPPPPPFAVKVTSSGACARKRPILDTGYMWAKAPVGMGSKRTAILSESHSPGPEITMRLLPCIRPGGPLPARAGLRWWARSTHQLFCCQVRHFLYFLTRQRTHGLGLQQRLGVFGDSRSTLPQAPVAARAPGQVIPKLEAWAQFFGGGVHGERRDRPGAALGPKAEGRGAPTPTAAHSQRGEWRARPPPRST